MDTTCMYVSLFLDQNTFIDDSDNDNKMRQKHGLQLTYFLGIINIYNSSMWCLRIFLFPSEVPVRQIQGTNDTIMACFVIGTTFFWLSC